MSNALKSELKQLVLHETGARVEDALELAKKDLASLEGRHQAMLDGAKVAEALLQAVDKDVEEGKFDLTVAEHVKRYLTRCSHALQNVARQADNLRIAQGGRVGAFEHEVKLLAKFIEEEKQKALAATKPPEQVSMPEGRPPDAAEPTIKQQRLSAAPPVKSKKKPRAANA